MSLKLSINPPQFQKRLVVFVAIFALLLQPMYALVVSQIASAATVTPGNMNGWVTAVNDGAAAVITHGDASVGVSALKMSTADNNDSRVRVTKNVNVKLSDVGAISYDAKLLTGPAGSANASFRLYIDNDGDNVGDQWVVYETYYNFDATNTTNNGAWQTWNVKDGKFWGAWNAAGDYTTNATLSTIPGITSNARIVGISLGMGNYNRNWSALVDNVVFNGDVTDFELDPYVPTPPPSKPSLSGDVIFDAIPATLASSYPSVGFQAQRMSELGDKITFAGTGRDLQQAAITLNSWACQTGSWDHNNCQTTPGATFSHPVTLKLYNVATDGSVGTPIAERTQTFNIPYRPSVDPTCVGGTAWRDTLGNCQNGFNHVVIFDLSGITVPNEIIYTVSYNTNTRGYAPIGVTGPYDFLNVSLSATAPLVGSDVNAGELFRNQDNTGLQVSTAYSATGNPAASFSAVPIQPPAAPTGLQVKETVSGNSVVHLGYTNKDKLTASWTAPVSGADSYIYTYWNDVTTSPYTAASPWTSPTSATSYPGTVNQGEGVHHWAVRSVKNGVASDLSTTYTYTYDKTRPEVALVSPADGAQNPANYVVKATDNFALKTVTGHIYNADNTVFVKNCSKTATPAETNEYLLDCATAGLGDGTYTIRYNALDMAGNLSATKTSKFIIDHTAPTATLSYSPNGPAWTKNSVTVTLTASEPIKQSALPGTWLKVSDTVYKKVYPVNAVQNVTLEDLAGNTGSVTVAIDWIDKVAPTAAINAPALTNSSNPHIEGIASDTLSGVNSHWFEIKAPNGTFYYVYGTSNFDLSEAKDNTVDKNPIVITEGEYQIRYVVTDKAGNRSDDPNYTHSTLHTITIDMTAPTVAIDPIADSTNTTPIISGVTSEKGGNVKISLNGTEVAVVTSDVDGNWSWTVSPELAVGDYTAGAIAVDGAGNESSVATTDFAILAQPTGPTGPTNPTNPGNPGGPTSEQPDPDAETPTQTENDEDDTTPTIAFLPQTISGANPGAAGTGALPIGDGNQSVGDVAGATADAETGKTDILGTEDTKAGWSLINAVMAGLVVLLGVVALAGIRRNSEGNHTGTRVLTVIPAAAATIVFFVVETVSAPMTWVNVWTWLFAAILVVQIILLSVAKPTSDG